MSSSAASMPETSLPRTQPTTPTSRVKSNDSRTASTVAAMPAGLWAASSSTVGDVRTRSSRPGRADGGERGAHGLLLDRAGGRTRAEERLDGRQRGDGVLRLVGPEQRQEDLLVLPAQALQAHLLAADGDPPLQHAELGALPRDDRLDLDRPADQRVERAGLLVGQHRDRVRLDDPGLLAGDGGHVGAEVLGVVHGRPA